MLKSLRAFGTAALLAAALGRTAAAQPADSSQAAPALRPAEIRINIPASRLDVYEDGRVVDSYTISVGSRRFRTPTGSFEIARVVWNPWWHPPKSKWAIGKKPTPPGPKNPMGRAKLNFHNLYFIHGTPDEKNLGRPASHGCVRMSNRDIVALARWVHEKRSPGVDASLLDSIAAHPKRTKTIDLSEPVPIHLVYEPVEVSADSVVLHPDVYGLARGRIEKWLAERLEQAGYDPARLDPERVRPAVRRAARTRVSLRIEELLKPEAAEPAPEERPVGAVR